MLVPFGNLQREIVANTLRPLRVVLYRRFMLRIASALAERSARHGAGHRREPGPGRVADAGEHGGDREGGVVSDPAPAGRDGQERDRRSGAPAAARSRLRYCPTRIAARCSCRRIRKPARESRKWRQAESRFDIARMIDDAVRATEVERFWFPPRAESRAARASGTQA